MTEWKDYDVEVFHNGEPQYIVTVHDKTQADAERRAITAVWMTALRDGREWLKESISVKCRYFALCENAATHNVKHPAFPSGVPTCDRCQDKIDAIENS